MRRLGSIVQAVVVGVLLGVAGLQLWARLQHAPTPPDEDLAKRSGDTRVFRYQAY